MFPLQVRELALQAAMNGAAQSMNWSGQSMNSQYVPRGHSPPGHAESREKGRESSRWDWLTGGREEGGEGAGEDEEREREREAVAWLSGLELIKLPMEVSAEVQEPGPLPARALCAVALCFDTCLLGYPGGGGRGQAG